MTGAPPVTRPPRGYDPGQPVRRPMPAASLSGHGAPPALALDPWPCAPRLATREPQATRTRLTSAAEGTEPTRPEADQALPKLDESGPNPGRFRATASRPQGCCSPSHSDWGRRVEGRAGAGMPLPFVL